MGCNRARGLAGVFLLVGCTGTVGDPREQGAEPGPPAGGPVASGGSGGSVGGTGSGGSSAGAAHTPEVAGLRRLTVRQYANSVRALFGPAIDVPTDLEPDTVLHGMAAIGASRIALSARATEQFEAAARSIAAQVVADTERREALVGCDPATEASCTRGFVERFGLRAWRRPLTSEEVARYTELAGVATEALSDPWRGIEYAIAGLLQSPHFLYRVEIGAADPSTPGLRRFDGYELASRLSFWLWNTLPDEPLLEAAASGELGSTAGLVAQATRLLDDSRSEQGIETFFDEVLGLATLYDLPQLPDAFPQVSPTLGRAMRTQTLMTATQWTLSDADLRDLFTTRSTFVDAELAALYGLEGVSGPEFVPVELPADQPRVGLLGHASILASNSHPTSTSPTRRGKFVREVLLCQAVPPPPPNVVTSLPEDAGDGPRTMREKLRVHAEDPACAACHASMDPIGLALEHFDGIGAFRTTDADQPIDASGELDGVAFEDARGLAAAVAAHPELATCVARHAYRYAQGHLEGKGEEALVQALGQRFASDGYRLRQLLLAIVSSEAFRIAADPQ